MTAAEVQDDMSSAIHLVGQEKVSRLHVTVDGGVSKDQKRRMYESPGTVSHDDLGCA